MPLVIGHSQVKYLSDYLSKDDFSVFSYPGYKTSQFLEEDIIFDVTPLFSFYLPHMKKKSEANAPGYDEDLTDFWLVDDMFTFENLGFSNTVENIKYLICADCEIGPIGFHDTRNPKAFYVSHSRVKMCKSIL